MSSRRGVSPSRLECLAEAKLFAALGFAAALTGRSLLRRALLVKLRRDMAALNAGDSAPLLAGYAQDAVLRFNEGTHRWAGEHRGKPAIALFLANFIHAGLHGEIVDVAFSGPLWRMTLLVRFDDWALDPAGEQEIYRNRTVLLGRTRRGRIVEQEDFYEDSERIGALERKLQELGVRALTG
jgi:ketosteroid isomerase-like protein